MYHGVEEAAKQSAISHEGHKKKKSRAGMNGMRHSEELGQKSRGRSATPLHIREEKGVGKGTSILAIMFCATGSTDTKSQGEEEWARLN